jgi:PKHD-type hydroxylase
MAEIEDFKDEDFGQSSEFLQTKMASLEISSINKSSLFNEEQCLSILKECIEELWLPIKVTGDENLHKCLRQKLRGDLEGFPFNDIRLATKTINTEVYDFNLLGIIDQDYPQIFKYEVNDYYEWHMDLNPAAPSRKLSYVINLSNQNEYTGGELEFLNLDPGSVDLNEPGSIIVFPSFMTYRIKPVLSGTKNIVIGHVHGAVFR